MIYFQLSNNVQDLRASPKSTSFKVKPFLSNKVSSIPTRNSLPTFIAVQLCGTYFRKECFLVWCQGGQYFSHANTQQLGSGKSSTKSKQEILSLFARKFTYLPKSVQQRRLHPSQSSPEWRESLKSSISFKIRFSLCLYTPLFSRTARPQTSVQTPKQESSSGLLI